MNDPIRYELPYREPWDWQQFHDHFALRLLPAVEHLDDGSYGRTFRFRAVTGWLQVRPLSDRPALELWLSRSCAAEHPALVARVRKMFDLDADPQAITAHLARDALLRPLALEKPEVRVPAAFDPFEQAIRAIAGQQVSIKAAVTITRRLVERLGEPLPDAPSDALAQLFPTPEAIAGASLLGIGMPAKRLLAMQRFAEAVAQGRLALDIEQGTEDLVERLCALPGIGPWTAEYIALRGFGAPDAFPAADLGLLKAPLWGTAGMSARALRARADAWRPFRAYAAIHIWRDYARGSVPMRPPRTESLSDGA
ncbi:DNA-3-methyladenine glycosylase family protein [Stutzerimonas urumqiensis]|uniref:DNA-3-methyladenine glycosylase family protein n=1 Tax=Stutzerimonas urumqiensis TaxID=638269 RepID=UPI000EB07CFF|nr:DNA-3-methyladenine glycosylase [Stutzerimonas urumqiensis]